jgi:GDP-mannose 6-dehydrogenase
VKVSVFGLGYVGCVTAASLAARGHDVIGVDVAEAKVNAVNEGRPAVLEPGLDDLVAATVDQGSLRATTDAGGAVAATELSLICVGTPSAPNGSLSLAALTRVMTDVGTALVGIDSRHTVVVRSTMLPGTAEEVLIPRLSEASGLAAGRDFGFAVNPEFLREGTSVDDFANPVKTVIGELDTSSGDVVQRLFEASEGTLIRTSVRAAEMAKYVDNAFHALKIAFANEIGAICRAFDLDSHEVMRSFFADTKLNISTAYLTPGFAFGGSCLPKDLRALLYASRRRDLDLPLLDGILKSNEECVRRVVDTILALGCRRVGLLGLSFKPDTDDLRESPLVELSERLLGKGCQLRIFDPQVSLGRLVGANRAYIDDHLPHVSALLADSLDDVLEHAEVCIVGAASQDAVHALAHSNGRTIVDLVRLPDAELRRGASNYLGVAW